MKKGELVFKTLVDMMLSKYQVNYDYVVANPVIDGEDWYIHYTWDSIEEEEFKKAASTLLKEKLRWSKKRIEKELGMFILFFGLKNTDYVLEN